MAYQDFVAKMRGYFPKCDVFLAQSLVSKAWEDIQKTRDWSFLLQDNELLCPGQLANTGTVSTTQYGTSLQFSSAAITAINAIPAATPVTQQQFRIPGFPVYNIVSWNSGTGVMTIDRPFGGGTASGQNFLIYQCYYAAPNDPNFRKWFSVYDPINAYPLYLNKSSQDFDRWDPQRQSSQFPYFLGYYAVRNGLKLYELWPTPTNQQVYRCKWVSGLQTFSGPTATVPSPISESLLMERAFYLGCQWASKMAGTYRELAGVNWNAEKVDHLTEYRRLLRDATIADEDSMQTMLIDNGDSDLTDGYPFTAEWYQHHDVVPGGGF